MHNFQAAFSSQPCLPSSRPQEMDSVAGHLAPPQSTTTPASPGQAPPPPFQIASVSSMNPVTVNNLASPHHHQPQPQQQPQQQHQHPGIGLPAQGGLGPASSSSSPSSNLNPHLNNFATTGIPPTSQVPDPFAAFSSTMAETTPDFASPAGSGAASGGGGSSNLASSGGSGSDSFPGAANFLSFIEEGQKMETRFTSILLESALKLSSLTNTSIFVMVETAHGGRKWAGRNGLRDNFLKGDLRVVEGDEELTSEEAEKAGPGFAFRPTRASESSARSPFGSPSFSGNAGAANPSQQQTPQSSSNAAAKMVSPSSGLEEGTVVGIQAFTLPAEGATTPVRGEPRKDLNSDFLDDAGGGGGSGVPVSKAEETKSESAPTIPQAPLLAPVADQIRYMTTQLKMTPDQIANVLGLPLAYVQTHVGNIAAKQNSGQGSGGGGSEFLSPNQSVAPYPSYMNSPRSYQRGSAGRGRQRVDVNRMRTLLTQRVPVKDIANEMGVSRLCVYYWMQKFGINAYSRRSWTSNDNEIASTTEDHSNEIQNGSNGGMGGSRGGLYQDASSSQESDGGVGNALVPVQQSPEQQQPVPSYMNSPSRGGGQAGGIGRPRGANNKVDVNLFKQLVTRKVPVGEIANEFGISRLAVYYHMHKLGFKPYMRPGRARARGMRGGLPGPRGTGVTMSLSSGAVGLPPGFPGGAPPGFGGRGMGANAAARAAALGGVMSLNDADPLGAFQQSAHRGFFEMSAGGLPTMVGYSNRYPGFGGGTNDGGGGPPVGGEAPGGAPEEGASYSEDEVEGNLDDIKIEEGVEMEDAMIGEDDATGSGLGDAEDEDDEEEDDGQNHVVDPMAAMEAAFP